MIAHRGTWKPFPEHSLEGFEKAYNAGTDFLEFDLQVTKDDHLVLLHDPDLSTSTDLLENHHREFWQKAYYDGSYFVQDFTLKELGRLNRKVPENQQTLS